MLTIKEVAKNLQCSRLVVDKLVVQGLPCINISSSPHRRRLRFDMTDVQSWLKEERTKDWQSAKARVAAAETELRRALAELAKLKREGKEPDDENDEEVIDDDGSYDEDGDGDGDGDTNET